MRSVEQLVNFGRAPGEGRTSRPRILFLAAYLWSAGLIFSVAVPVTNSGVLALYGSDLVAVPIFILVAVLLVRRRKSLARSVWVYAAVYGAFFVYCMGALVYRLAGDTTDLQSLVIPRANLASSAILILFVLGIYSAREAVLGAFIFSTTLAIAALPLAVFDIYLPFSIFENLAIRTDVQLFLMPLLLLGLLFKRRLQLGRIYNWMFAVCLFSLAFGAAVSGARVNAVLLPAFIAMAAFLLVLLSRGRARFTQTLVSVVVPVVAVILLLVVVAPTNERVQYGLERNILYSAIADRFMPSAPANPEPSSSVPTEDDQQTPSPGAAPAPDPAAGESIENDAEQSLEASTSSRSEVWAKAWTGFTANPLFGTGLKQYAVTYGSGTETFTSIIQPHNFLIEYLMAYGIVGFALWLGILFYWPIRSLRLARANKSNAIQAFGLFAVSIAFVFGASFLQPLMLYPTTLLITYFVIGAFARILNNEAPEVANAEGHRAHEKFRLP
jgi:hypothetical protein